ncbi:hypothetical protein [Winogradskyella haliclonae]|nr:hypothetical protein [Winogradskyella haliclonae]
MIKTKFIVLLASCLIVSCNSEEIEVELVDKKLFYSAIFNKPKGKELTRIDTIQSVYSRYLSETDWKKSLNEIEFKIKNKTENKIFLVNRKTIINQAYKDELDTYSEKFDSDIYFEVKDSLGRKLSWTGSLHWINNGTIPHNDIKKYKEQFQKLNSAIENTIYNNFDDEKRLKNFEILNPGETITIKANLSLPIPIDYNNILDYNTALPMYKNNIYRLRLHYLVNKKDIENSLPKHILDSLKRENIIIRDIQFSSKEIQVSPN